MTKGTDTNKRNGVVAIIPAAGRGLRMGKGVCKQFLDLGGKPLLTVTLERFEACPSVQGIIVVVPPEQREYCRTKLIEPYGIRKVEKVVAGGERRQDSVRFGIESSEGNYETVLIHDGVRPFIAPELVERMISLANDHRALIAAIPSKDTIKEVGDGDIVTRTYDRKNIWMVQTPQVFRYEDILEAHREALRKGWQDVTDDALLVERMGVAVKVVEGSEMNIKVTTPHDLYLAKCLLKLLEGSARKGQANS